MREVDFGVVLGGTIVVCVITLSVCLATIFEKTPAERCAAACGPGRFMSWTARTTKPMGQTDVPEKCECGP